MMYLLKYFRFCALSTTMLQFKIKYLPILAILVATLIWASDSLLRVELYKIPAIVVVFLEHFFGLITFIFVYKNYLKDLLHLTSNQKLAMLWTGVFAGTLAGLFYTSGLVLVLFASLSVVVLMQHLQPIWGIIAARIVLKEKITPLFIGFATLAVIGAYLITFKNIAPNLGTGDKTPLAGLFGLLAGVFWGVNTAVSKYNLNTISFQSVAVARYLIASVSSSILIIVSIFLNSVFNIKLTGFWGDFGSKFVEVKNFTQIYSLSNIQWINLFLIVFFVGIVSMSLYYWGLKKVPSKVATISELGWPMWAFLLDILYFKTTFTTSQIFGIVLLVGSVYVISLTQTNSEPIEIKL
jgi:drug/metabolite transporter (DMT)-like permease